MARLQIAVAIVCALAVFSSVAWAQESDVVVLTSANFDQVLKDNQDVFIKFYAPYVRFRLLMGWYWSLAWRDVRGG